MSTDVISIDAKPRERTGSRYSRRLRAAGGLPAVVYGHKQNPEAVTLDAKQAMRQIDEGQKLFKISLGSGEDTVLLKDIQFDHLGRDIIHVDLERVNLDERVTVKIPVKLKGDAPGLSAAGAILMHPVSELEVECTEGNLEDSIVVDISELQAGDSIHASEVDMPHQYKLLTDPDSVVAGIMIKAEIEESDEAAEGAAEMTAPEVITERKDDDEKSEE
jgi:large subunit ribosomal protein L25